MPKNQVVGLSTLRMNSSVPGFVSTEIRPLKKRVFTEDEINYLNTRSINDLRRRIETGRQLIGLLHRPDMLNMTQAHAAAISSNLKYQIETIQAIVDKKQLENKGV